VLKNAASRGRLGSLQSDHYLLAPTNPLNLPRRLQLLGKTGLPTLLILTSSHGSDPTDGWRRFSNQMISSSTGMEMAKAKKVNCSETRDGALGRLFGRE